MFFLFATSALIAVAVFLKYTWRRLKYYQLMPSTRHFFFNILGDLTKFDLLKNLPVQMAENLGKILKLFPKKQIVCVWFSYSPVVFIVKADAAKEVLKVNKMMEKSFHYEWLKPFIGAGLIVSSSEKWKSRRRLFNPCFHSNILRQYLNTFNCSSQKLVKVLKEKSQKDYVEILEPLSLCAFNSICETIFGSRVGASDNNTTQVLKYVKRCAGIVVERSYSVWLHPEFIFRHTKTGKTYYHQTNIIKACTKNMIEEKKKAFLSGEREFSDGKHKAFIDVLLEKHLVTNEFSEEDINEEANTFLSAGNETVGVAAMWAIYLIGQHPEVQSKLHEEIDLVFGEDRDRPVMEQDLKDLKYMDCVLKECIRIYPSVPLLARNVKEDMKICGYTVPKDTTCCVLTYFLHRDEEVFPDPEKFDPNRFAPENRVNIPEFAYIPFSGGPRNCIGYKFAEMEVTTMIAFVLRNFTVETLNKVKPILGISLYTSEPIRIKIKPRP